MFLQIINVGVYIFLSLLMVSNLEAKTPNNEQCVNYKLKQPAYETDKTLINFHVE